MNLLLKYAVVTSVILSSFSALASDQVLLTKRLHDIANSSSLDNPALKPWHLKLAVQLFDAKGNPSEQGNIEEWWTPNAYKRVYTTPSYSATEIRSNKATYRTKGQATVPYLLDAALRLVEHPMASTEVIDKSNPEMLVQIFGKVKLDCLVLSKNSIGRVPTFCLDQGGDQLRLSWLDPQVSTRNSIGLFQGVKVGVDTSISLYGLKSISEHIDALDDKSFDLSIFMPNNDLEERPSDAVWVSADTATTTTLHKTPPIYPDEAKSRHVSGAVMLIVAIGADGHVDSADVLGAPDPSLAKSAVAAVKQWVYTPYLINGVAVKRQTTVSIHYNFGN